VRKIAVFGATSLIAQEYCRLVAAAVMRSTSSRATAEAARAGAGPDDSRREGGGELRRRSEPMWRAMPRLSRTPFSNSEVSTLP